MMTSRVSGDNFWFSSEIVARDSRRCGDVTNAAAGSSIIQFQSSSSVGSGSGDNTSTKAQRYKTELCRAYEENGSCRYGDKCQFAHGVEELRSLARHPKYKTDLCKTFHTTGFCPYGARCHFIHGEYKDTAATLTLRSSDVRDTNVSRLLNSLDDGLLLALASLIQSRHDGSTAVAARSLRSSGSCDQSSASGGTPSPCPSPSSVSSHNGICSPRSQFVFSQRRSNDSSCESPDVSSYSSLWMSSVNDSPFLLSPSNCQLQSSYNCQLPPSNCQLPPSYSYTRPVSTYNKVARSIFA